MGFFSRTIKCKNCGKEISKHANMCPYCGCTVNAKAVELANNNDVSADFSQDIRKMREKMSQPQIATGHDFYAFVRKDGTVSFNPDTDESRVKRFFKLSDPTPVTKGFVHNLEDWRNIKSIVSGGNYIIGLKQDGTVLASGSNTHWTCEVEDWRNVESLKIFDKCTLGICNDGTVLCTSHQKDISKLRDVIQIVGFGNNLAFLTKAGNVELLEDNDEFDLTAFSDVEYLACMNKDLIGIKKDGTLVCTDADSAEQIKDWKKIIKVEYGSEEDEHGIVALSKDGYLYTTIKNTKISIARGWENLVDFKCANGFIIGLKSDGHVVAAGDNEYGSCNVSSWVDVIDVCAEGKAAVALNKNEESFLLGLCNNGGSWTTISMPWSRLHHGIIAQDIGLLLPGRTFCRRNYFYGEDADEISVDVKAISDRFPSYKIKPAPQVYIVINDFEIQAIAIDEDGTNRQPVVICELSGNKVRRTAKMRAKDIFNGIYEAQQQ